MLCKRVIVCLDVRDGEVVKGVKFVDLRQVGDPAELAARYQQEGADEVVFLDISASHEGRKTMHEVVRRTAEQLFVPLTVGGGIDSVDDIGLALRAGADKVSINTAAVRNPALLEEAAERFGRQCIVASIDAKLERGRAIPGEAGAARPTPVAGGRAPVASGYRVYTHGGRTPTDLDAVAWARECAARGAGEILLTAIDRDGGRDGYDLELTRMVVDAVLVPVVASGGAGDAAHLCDAFLIAGADAALAAGIFHDRLVSIGEVKRALAGAGLPVRIQEEAV
jgi:cyclase